MLIYCPVLPRSMATRIILRGLTASVSLLCLAPVAVAKNTQYIYGTSIDGITRLLAVDRTPALFTGNFGDCSGGQGLFNITKFDAAVSLNPNRVSSLIMFKRKRQRLFQSPATSILEVS